MNPRVLRAVGPAILVIAAIASLVGGLLIGGGAAPLLLQDPGPAVRWGLPIAKLVVNLSAAVTVGPLVLALFALPARSRPFDVAFGTASIGAAVFTVSSGVVAFLSFLDIFNPRLDAGPEFGAQLGRFLVEQEAGVAWLVTTLLAAVVTTLTFVTRSWLGGLGTAVMAVASLVPMATQGHSGDLASHNQVVTAMMLHIVGAAIWLGGLVLVVVLRPVLDARRMRVLLLRYSSLALLAFCLVAVSGVVRSLAAIGSWQQLVTPYGAVLLTKVAALCLLGVLGAWYRRSALSSRPRRGGFWGLIAVELAVMGVASGAAAALARSAPPLEELLPVAQTPAEILADGPLPPELTVARWFTQWDVDLLWLVVAVLGAFFYLVGVWRLRRRGDRWPVYRTVLWLTGMLLLAWVTSGPINAYQEYLFSVHMLGHMLLTMAIPLLLVPGAPVTLAARAIHRRDDGSRGGREWILWAVHSPAARVLTHPIVAAVVFIGSLWVFYFTDLMRWALYDHLGHIWMVSHFLVSGYLFALSMTGIDPVPRRLPYPGRLVTLIVTMAMHAFFGIAIMMNTGLMAAEWYGSMGRTWGPTPLEDQYVGGGIAWSIGEIPTLIMAIVVAVQWSRSDARVQRRRDRQADRSGDAELAEYNARLAALAERDQRLGQD